MTENRTQNVAEWYDRQAAGYSQAAQRPLARIRLETVRHVLLDASTDVPTGLIVDLGCGTGQSTETIRSIFPFAKIAGIDCSAAEIDIAVASAKTAGLDIDYDVDDIFCRAFASGSVDLFVAVMSIHYFRDATQLVNLLKQLAAALTEQGRLVVQIPNPAVPLPYRDYGVEHLPKNRAAIGEGDPYQVNLYALPHRHGESDWGDPLVTFTNYRHSWATFADAFASAGLAIHERKLVIPEELYADDVGVVWDDLEALPLYRTLIATKIE